MYINIFMIYQALLNFFYTCTSRSGWINNLVFKQWTLTYQQCCLQGSPFLSLCMQNNVLLSQRSVSDTSQVEHVLTAIVHVHKLESSLQGDGRKCNRVALLFHPLTHCFNATHPNLSPFQSISQFMGTNLIPCIFAYSHMLCLCTVVDHALLYM